MYKKFLYQYYKLNQLMPVLPSYRNQSIDLSKSIDWFLYAGNTGIWWVNHTPLWYFELWVRSAHSWYKMSCRRLAKFVKRNSNKNYKSKKAEKKNELQSYQIIWNINCIYFWNTSTALIHWAITKYFNFKV